MNTHTIVHAFLSFWWYSSNMFWWGGGRERLKEGASKATETFSSHIYRHFRYKSIQMFIIFVVDKIALSLKKKWGKRNAIESPPSYFLASSFYLSFWNISFENNNNFGRKLVSIAFFRVFLFVAVVRWFSVQLSKMWRKCYSERNEWNFNAQYIV